MGAGSKSVNIIIIRNLSKLFCFFEETGFLLNLFLSCNIGIGRFILFLDFFLVCGRLIDTRQTVIMFVWKNLLY